MMWKMILWKFSLDASIRSTQCAWISTRKTTTKNAPCASSCSSTSNCGQRMFGSRSEHVMDIPARIAVSHVVNESVRHSHCFLRHHCVFLDASSLVKYWLPCVRDTGLFCLTHLYFISLTFIVIRPVFISVLCC